MGNGGPLSADNKKELTIRSGLSKRPKNKKQKMLKVQPWAQIANYYYISSRWVPSVNCILKLP